MPCFPSLARPEKKLLRLAGEATRRAGGVSHPIIPQGKQNGHYGRRKGNKTAIMAATRETKRHYDRRKANRRGVTPPWV